MKKNSHSEEIAAYHSADRRRLDRVLKECLPRSYDTFPERYRRASDALRRAVNLDDSLTYSGSAHDVRDWLAFIAKFNSDNIRPVRRFKAELKKALKSLKSGAARDSGKAGWIPGNGKFIRKNALAP